MIHGINYWALPQGMEGTLPIADALEKTKSLDLPALELCISAPSDDAVLHTQSTREACEAIREQIEASGIIVQTLAAGLTWGCSPTSDDANVRKQSIELHANALERAGWLGCEAMLMVPGIVGCPFVPDEKVRYDIAHERCKDAVQQLLPVAKRAGVKLCLENVWNGMFVSPNDWCAFIDDLNDDSLGIYFDVGNVIGYHQDPAHWIEMLGKRIARVHIKDFKHNFGWSGDYSFCELGQGDVPWDRTMQALKAIGYDKTLIAEMLPWSEGLPEKSAKAMKQLCL